jgi:predicted GNAT family acetyltransferase
LLYPLSYGAVAWRRAVAAPMRRGYPVARGTPATPDSSREVSRTDASRGYRSGYTSGSGNGAGGREGEKTMDTKVVDVPEKGRFEVRLDDRVVGLASYHVDGTTMTLPHTEVDPGVGGRGIGTALVTGVLDAARERGLTVLPYCSFIRHYIQQHPDQMDLVAAEDRPHFGLETADR